MTVTAGPASDERSGTTPTADVSVVIVNWNSGEDLSRCVASVLESTGDARVQVVVVDNHSGDGSADRARDAFPVVRVIHNVANRGFGAAANQGIRASDADWVFLLNPDARIAGGTLGGVLKVASGHPRAGAIGVLTRTEDGAVYPSARKVPSYAEAAGHAMLAPFAPNNRWSRAYTMAGWDRSTERQVDWVSGSSMLLRREALDRVGVFDEDYFLYVEDLDLCTRLREDGWEVWFTPELDVVHAVGSVTRGKRRMTQEHARSMYRYFVKRRSPGARAALRPAAWLVLTMWAEVVSRRRGER
ncbi:MAG TPA: glycosyltransferase family 2 protein [Actinomycetota bacterium]